MLFDVPDEQDQVRLDNRAARILRARRRARFLLLALLLVVVAAILAARASTAATDHELFHQKRLAVIEVESGDTLMLAGDEGLTIAVRLIGVDANGSEEARAAAAEICGEEVLLYLESAPTRNHAGQLLAYVYAPDGTHLNAWLIETGVAFTDRRWDYSFARTFQQLEEEAYSRRRGLWAAMTEERMPEWRRRWLAEMRRQLWERAEWRREDEP
jgi:endonuclease YncB( thermonuclease family)